MSIRPIGERVLVRPLAAETVTESAIVLPDGHEPLQTTAEVVAVGTLRCPECASELARSLTPGMRVALRPDALYDEISLSDGEPLLWMVRLDDVIGEILPLEATA